MSDKGMKGEKGNIGEQGAIGPRGDEWMNDSNSRHSEIERHLLSLMNLLGVKTSNFYTKEIYDKPNTEITKHDQRIINICKSSEHVLSLQIEGYHITPEGKLYQGWWNQGCPHSVIDKFKYNNQWINENIKGAKFLYVLTTFWGCNHTIHYVFEYEDGTYKFISDTFATT